MSRRYETVCTVTIGGDEQDITVSALVEYGPDLGGPNGWGAMCDGEVKAFVGGTWVPLDDLDLDAGDYQRAEQALEEACCEDDSDARSCA